jgi:hypothetical protein
VFPLLLIRGYDRAVSSILVLPILGTGGAVRSARYGVLSANQVTHLWYNIYDEWTSSMAENPKPTNGWLAWFQTLPGILTGIATLLATVASLVTLLHKPPDKTTPDINRPLYKLEAKGIDDHLICKLNGEKVLDLNYGEAQVVDLKVSQGIQYELQCTVTNAGPASDFGYFIDLRKNGIHPDYFPRPKEEHSNEARKNPVFDETIHFTG